MLTPTNSSFWYVVGNKYFYQHANAETMLPDLPFKKTYQALKFKFLRGPNVIDP